MKKMFFVAFVMLCAASVSYAGSKLDSKLECWNKCEKKHESVLKLAECIDQECGGYCDGIESCASH